MLRDKFAMAAMQGFLANSGMNTGNADGVIAEAAYRHADAMMKERAKQDFSGDPEHPMHLEPVVRYQEGCAVGKSPTLDIAETALYNECVETAALDGVKKMLAKAIWEKHKFDVLPSSSIAVLIEQLKTGLPF